jgi:L-lactate dehydrogenase complex protein LldG
MGAVTVATATGVAGFVARAEVLGAEVRQADSEEAGLDLIRDGAARFAVTESARSRFPTMGQALQPSSVGHRDQPSSGGQVQQPSSGGQADRPSGDTSGTPADVVAGAVFAVAETGSVVLDEPQNDRGRCFLADRLWVLVREQDILASLDEAMQRMRELVRAGAHHPLLMSGPSRTADIERVLTVGVHGPRAVTIVVVAPSTPSSTRPSSQPSTQPSDRPSSQPASA